MGTRFKIGQIIVQAHRARREVGKGTDQAGLYLRRIPAKGVGNQVKVNGLKRREQIRDEIIADETVRTSQIWAGVDQGEQLRRHVDEGQSSAGIRDTKAELAPISFGDRHLKKAAEDRISRRRD